MKISAIALNYAPQRMGGTETYLLGIAEAFTEKHEDTDLFWVTPQGVPVGLGNEENKEIPKFHIPNSRFMRGKNFLKGIFLSKRIWAEIGPSDIDFFPLTAGIPKPRNSKKTVVIIHDLQHRDLPQNFSLATRIYRKWAYESVWKKESHIVTVSEVVRQSVHKHLGIPLERITKIYPGIDQKLFCPGAFEPPIELAGKKYIFYPARALAHKNHERLFEAFEIVRKEEPDLFLVLTGGDSSKLESIPENVIHLGHLNALQISNLYRGAEMTVFPSLYEGFGFPPLEAMSSGCKIAVSDLPILREVCSGFAEYFNPLSAQSIAQKILITRNSSLNQNELIEYTKKFSWNRSSSELEQVFHEIAKV